MRFRRRTQGARRRRVWLVTALLLVVAAALVWRPVARTMAHVLIVQDALRPAAAILVLQGGLVFRDSEAAELYRAGLAPRLIISRDVPPASIAAARAMGIEYPVNHELSVQVLRRLGVPDEAVVTLERPVRNTVEELTQAYAYIGPGTEPVIAITSPYHTRRVSLVWQRVSGGRRPILLAPARAEPFDPDAWWGNRDYTLALVREYLGLLAFVTGRSGV